MEHGFFVPVVAVEGDDGRLVVVDGQHRLAAFRKVASGKVPVVVVPKEYALKPLLFNVEKSDNVKDMCEKAYLIYVDLVRVEPEGSERETIGPSVGYAGWLCNLAFAYKESGLKSPSLVESVVKKLDPLMMDDPLEAAVEVRRMRGGRLKELEELVLGICSEYGVSDFNLRKSIVSQASQELWGRRRSVGVGFEEGMVMLMDKIEEMDWSWLAGRR